MSKQLYEWVTIKSEKDLPKEKGEYLIKYKTGELRFVNNMLPITNDITKQYILDNVAAYLAPVTTIQVSEDGGNNELSWFRKPTKIEAIQLMPSYDSILSVERFIAMKEEIGHNSNSIAAELFEDYTNIIIASGGRKIKTAEGELFASFGDYIVKGFTEKLGFHFWPVKPDYFELNYERRPIHQPLTGLTAEQVEKKYGAYKPNDDGLFIKKPLSKETFISNYLKK